MLVWGWESNTYYGYISTDAGTRTTKINRRCCPGSCARKTRVNVREIQLGPSHASANPAVGETKSDVASF